MFQYLGYLQYVAKKYQLIKQIKSDSKDIHNVTHH